MGAGVVGLVDLLGGAQFQVDERRVLHGVEVGDLVEMRLVGLADQVVFARTFIFHPTAARSDFRLTAAGQAHVTEHAEQIAAAWDIASDDETGQLRGATMKLMGALRQFGADATPDQQKRASEKVDALRKELYAILGE